MPAGPVANVVASHPERLGGEVDVVVEQIETRVIPGRVHDGRELLKVGRQRHRGIGQRTQTGHLTVPGDQAELMVIAASRDKEKITTWV